MSQPSPQPSSVSSTQQHSSSTAIAQSGQASDRAVSYGTRTLHPALQNALDCLDVDLDEELSRYRRHCLIQQRVARRRRVSGSSSTAFSQGQPAKAASRAVSGAVQPTTASQSLLSSDSTDITDIAAVTPIASTAEVATMETSVVNFENVDLNPVGLAVEARGGTDSSTSATANPDDYLESSAELLRSLAEEEQRAKAIAAETEETRESTFRTLWASALTPLGVGSILLMILSSATLGYLILRPTTMEWFSARLSNVGNSGHTDDQESGLSNLAPDLAAGEFDPLRANNLSSLPPFVTTEDELGDSAVEEETVGNLEETGEDAIVAQTNWPQPAAPQSRNTPAVSPASGGNNNAPVAPTPAPAPVRSAAPAPAPAPSPIVFQPASPVPVAAPITPAPVLSPQPVEDTASTSPENEVSNSTTTPSDHSPERTTTNVNVNEVNEAATENENGGESEAGEAIATTPSNPDSAAASPAAIPVIDPPSAASNSASTGSAAAPVSSSPVTEDLYYVTTPYTGDQSLEEAQGAVSGSYVRNFPTGTQVQMGAFSSPSGAEELIQNLENQGIPAGIYENSDGN